MFAVYSLKPDRYTAKNKRLYYFLLCLWMSVLLLLGGCTEEEAQGISASLSAAFPPPPPENVHATPSYKQIILSWKTSENSSLKLYYGIQSNIDPQNPDSYLAAVELASGATSHIIKNLVNDTTYYFVLGPLYSNAFDSGARATPPVNAMPQSITVVAMPITPLNDTGIDWCADRSNTIKPCPIFSHPEQDRDYGRDAFNRIGTLIKTGGGSGGFDFTKLGSNGQPLDNQNQVWVDNGNEDDGTQWSCVRDNHTGLTWEVKVNNLAHLRHYSHTYTWYSSDARTHGGHEGTEKGGQCSGSHCDTEDFVRAVNSEGLCGARDWRMPTRAELASITHLGHNTSPLIEKNYFPHTAAAGFWSASSFAGNTANAWYVHFGNGRILNTGKHLTGSVRLVSAQ